MLFEWFWARPSLKLSPVDDQALLIMFFLMMLGIVEKHCTYDNRTARTDQKL
jgi:hypothetical protein